MGLIINELVSNSLKHAFNGYDKGEIKIILEKNDETYKLTIKDNGIGLPKGFNLKETTSLGILLINSLVNQLEGKIYVEVNGGTLFTMILLNLYTWRECKKILFNVLISLDSNY